MTTMTDQLVATCWTSAGNTSPQAEDPRSPVDFRERVEAAGRTGYVGMGFILADLVRAEERYGLAGMKSILDDNGMVRREVEFLMGWWATGPEREASDADRRAMLRYVEELGANLLKVGPQENDSPWQLDHWAREFSALADQAAGVGARLAIEFLPWANIDTLGTANALIDAAGNPNGGMVIDVWHVERVGTPHDEVAATPGERIFAVELSDAAKEMVGSWTLDTADRRRYCGDGDFKLPSLVAALRQAGFQGPWGVEILSAEHRVLPVEEALTKARDTTLALLGC